MINPTLNFIIVFRVTYRAASFYEYLRAVVDVLLFAVFLKKKISVNKKNFSIYAKCEQKQKLFLPN